MAQAKKKTATKTAKKATAVRKKKTGSKSYLKYEKYQRGQQSNMVFVIMMTVLAATLLFADMLMMTA
jgi:hypothetical protein